MYSRWLVAYMRTVEAGSISKAAKSLFVTPQALTQQLNLLENEVGVKLFERSTKGVRPTLAGEEFLEGARQMSQLWDATLQRCLRASKRAETVFSPICTAFPAHDFEAAYYEYQRTKSADEPDLRLTVDNDFKNWIEGVYDGSYDFIRYVSIDGTSPKGMYFEPVRDLLPWCLLDAGHPLAGHPTITVDDLDGATIVTNDIRVTRKLRDVVEERRLAVEFREVPLSRLHIVDAASTGCVCIFTEGFARAFEGYRAVPLDFEVNTWEGLLCPESSRERLAHIFEIAHRNMIERAEPLAM